MLIFNRGLHCPICRAQLSEMNRRIGELEALGVELFSISAETEERARRMRDEWEIDRIPLAYGFSEAEMRTWGLFVSRGRTEGEPPIYNEPAIFLLRPDRTIYYEAILSMPVGRPRLDDLLKGIRHWEKVDYQPRGAD
jgi:peroxiredoxin